MTMRALADKLGVTSRAVTAYESGAYAPDDAVLATIARVLGYSRAFFDGDDIEVPKEAAVSFRARASMSARERSVAIAAAGVAMMVTNWLNERFSLPAASVPDLAGVVPETAARMVRAEWGLGERPIRNMIHLLELHGVRVFSLPSPSRKLDAFAFWRDDEPYVLLNTTTSAERSRMDAAHELAHLVLHREGRGDPVKSEQEAARFASAFLLPESNMLSLGKTTWTLLALRQTKKPWGVSVIALARRLHDLGLITDWNYHVLCIQISEAGYRTTEPEAMPHESSQLLKKVFDMLRPEGLREIADDLLLRASDLMELVFHLVPLKIEGTGRQSALTAPARKLEAAKLELRLIAG